MKEIPLTQGKVALVDDDDFEELNRFKWCVSKSKSTFYAVRRIHGSGNNQESMHRQILNATKGKDVDHINHNGLDNQRKNLRLCQHSENLRNHQRSPNPNSGFKGVCWDGQMKRWRAQIRRNGKTIFLGLFTNAKSAAKAYDKSAKEFFGKFAFPNFSGKSNDRERKAV